MKTLLIGFILSLASVSHAGILTIENATDKKVSVGVYSGIKLPSICESTGYGFCWEEAFVSFKPLSSKMKNIQGSVTVDVEKETSKTELFLMVDDEQLEILGSCSKYSADTLGYVLQVENEVYTSEIQNSSICLINGTAKIIID